MLSNIYPRDVCAFKAFNSNSLNQMLQIRPHEKIIFSVFGIAVCFVVGTVTIMYMEGYSFITSLYLSVQTTMVGIFTSLSMSA